jgi:hypothetical protein
LVGKFLSQTPPTTQSPTAGVILAIPARIDSCTGEEEVMEAAMVPPNGSLKPCTRALTPAVMLAGVVVDGAPPRVCDRASHEFRPVGRRACRVTSHNRWHCASVRCCSDQRRLLSSRVHPAGCTLILERFVPAFQFTVGLRIAGRGPHMKSFLRCG